MGVEANDGRDDSPCAGCSSVQRDLGASRCHCKEEVGRVLTGYDQRMSGESFNSQPATVEVGTVWGFVDFSGEIQTH